MGRDRRRGGGFPAAGRGRTLNASWNRVCGKRSRGERAVHAGHAGSIDETRAFPRPLVSLMACVWNGQGAGPLPAPLGIRVHPVEQDVPVTGTVRRPPRG